MHYGIRTFALIATIVAAAPLAPPAAAQTYVPEKPRKHFITISADWLYTQPLHFAEHPVEDLVGADVASAQLQDHDYETRDGAILVDVLEFKRRTRGAGITVYPLGSSVGATLALRGAYEQLPVIRIAFTGTGAPPDYALTGARAYDIGAGLHVADRSSGWGLGSHAYLGGGIGRIRSDLGDGRRVFAEAGGGLSSGPIGVELGVKFAWNTLQEPVEHRFLTVPITLRGSLTF
jgi:hypothetical protein